MSDTDPPPEGPRATPDSLRQRAEAHLSPRLPATDPGTADALKLLHELQVHQIELQMQNEALQQSEAEARQALQRLAELHGSMERQVLARTADLREARDAADAANQAKGTFLSNMSHELRTPLNGVLGMIGLASGRATDAQQIGWLDKATGAATYLLSIVNDVLDFSKIDAGKMTLAHAEFRLGSVLALVADLMALQAAEKGIAFTVDVAPGLAERPVVGDAQRLTQVLMNLAGNAVKFTDAGSVHTQVRVVHEQARAIMVRFELKDTGTGIAPGNLARLFQAFEQIDVSPSRPQSGTGLGLVICKRMVQLMGGEIGVDSTPGLGSTFWFTVRLGQAAAVPAEGAGPPEPDALATLLAHFAGTRVLVVEDNAVNQEVLCALLECAALQVQLAESGAAALDCARRAPCALILMDVQMPVMDGLQATRAIRQVAGFAQTPIIALTASAFAQDRQRCLDAGMNDHLAKPVDPALLYSTLLKWLAPTAAAGSA